MNLGAKRVLGAVPQWRLEPPDQDNTRPGSRLASGSRPGKEPMHIVRTTCLIFAAGNLFLPIPLTALPPAASSFPMKLSQGWAIQSSVDVRENGAAISTVGYQPNDWYRSEERRVGKECRSRWSPDH